MVRVLFLFFTRFHVEVPVATAIQHGTQKFTHAYYAIASSLRCEGHLYELFLILAKMHLIYLVLF